MYRSFLMGAIFLGIILSLFYSSSSSAQSIKPYIGIHGGINLCQPDILQEYQIITLLDSDEPIEVEYDPIYKNFGHQIGFSLFLELTDKLEIGLMPQQARYSYGYSSILEFTDYQGNIISETENTSNQRLTYINIPLIVKYTLRETDFTPYLIAGFSYGILRSAQHDVVTVITGEIQSSASTSDNYSTEFISSKLSLLGGAGISYDFTQFRLDLDASYWFGLNNIVHEGNRFSNQTISGNTYDIPADTKLHHIVLNLSVLFPINEVNDRGSLDCVPFKKRK